MGVIPEVNLLYISALFSQFAFPMVSKGIFPVYTQVENPPVTILKALDAGVFDYPFFNEGVHNEQGFNIDKRIYSFSDLKPVDERDLLQIKGFIFHTSHCGSTLLARMLGSLPGVRVVSETEAINGLLLSHVFYDLQEEDLLLQLKQVIEAYRQPLKGEKFLVFKLSSWNVWFIHLFQQLYPELPWIFIDRNTGEVVKALMEKGGGFTDWWEHPTDLLRRYFLGNDFVGKDKTDYLMEMVKGHRQVALKNKNAQSFLLNYPGFISEFENVILPHFNLAFSEAEVQQAIGIKKYDAKKMVKTLFKST